MNCCANNPNTGKPDELGHDAHLKTALQPWYTDHVSRVVSTNILDLAAELFEGEPLDIRVSTVLQVTNKMVHDNSDPAACLQNHVIVHPVFLLALWRATFFTNILETSRFLQTA